MVVGPLWSSVKYLQKFVDPRLLVNMSKCVWMCVCVCGGGCGVGGDMKRKREQRRKCDSTQLEPGICDVLDRRLPGVMLLEMIFVRFFVVRITSSFNFYIKHNTV